MNASARRRALPTILIARPAARPALLRRMMFARRFLCTAALAVTFATPAAAQDTPLGIPVPADPTLADVVSTSGEDGDVQGVLPGASACRSAPHRAISLPADDAPHDDTEIEWWWWTGHLRTADGRRLAYFVWFASKPWLSVQMADYAITDLSTGQFRYGRQPLIAGHPQRMTDGFRLRGGGARAAGGDGRDAIHIEVGGYELELKLKTTKPPVLEFEDGFGTAYCNSAYVYRRVRMRTTGTLTHGGKRSRLRGTSDFARAWGFLPGVEPVNTSYFTFRLADGRDLFLFLIRLRKDGEEATVQIGSLSDAQGEVTTLHRRDFSLTPTRYWQRDAGCSYPVEYDVRVPGLRLHVRPALEGTEIRALAWPVIYALWPAWPVYWDGPTVVSGGASGQGWMDLSHYCVT